ncbi:hypothetical protein ACWDOP_07525 [Nocardia sp. NPDC003693]
MRGVHERSGLAVTNVFDGLSDQRVEAFDRGSIGEVLSDNQSEHD